MRTATAKLDDEYWQILKTASEDRASTLGTTSRVWLETLAIAYVLKNLLHPAVGKAMDEEKLNALQQQARTDIRDRARLVLPSGLVIPSNPVI